MDNMRRWHIASREGEWVEIMVKGIPKQGYLVKSPQNYSEGVVGEFHYMEDGRLFIVEVEGEDYS